jgi:hypothetical protein
MNRLRIVLLMALAAVACSDDQSSLAHTPIRVVFLTEPSDVAANSSLPGIDIGIVDGTGAIRNDATSAVTIAILNNPGGATLSGTSTVNAVNGIASFSGLTLDKAATGYTLVASSAGLQPDTSRAFSITP